MNRSNSQPSKYPRRVRAKGRLPTVLLIAFLGFGTVGQQAAGQGENRESHPANDGRAVKQGLHSDRVAVVNIQGHWADGEVLDIDAFPFIGPLARVGTGGDDPMKASNPVYFFELPPFVSGEDLISASLHFNYVRQRGRPEFNADLYGLGWISTPPVINPAWFWADAEDDVRTGNQLDTNIGAAQVTKLQNDIMTSTWAGAAANTPGGIVKTDAAGDEALLAFLKSLYPAGAQPGDFAVLRLSPDKKIANNSPRRGYTVSMADDPNHQPVLTLGVVADPSAVQALRDWVRRLDQAAEGLHRAGRPDDAKRYSDKADRWRGWLAELERRNADAQNLVVNGSFEQRETGTPPIPYREFRPGQKDLVGWEITGDNIDWIGPTRWQPAHGSHSLDLDGPRSGIQQTIETVPGKLYRLQFRLAGNVEGGPAKRNLHVIIDDVVLDFAFDVTGKTKQEMGWVSKEIIFTAASDATRLAFVNPHAESTRFGVALDHIVVRPVDSVRHPATPTEQVERHSAAEKTPAPPAKAAAPKPKLAAQLADTSKAEVTELDSLSELQDFERLKLRGRQVSDLAPLAELKNLWWLWLNDTAVRDLAPLAKLLNLRELYITGLGGTPVRDLAPLAGLHNLEKLYLTNTPVTDLAPLARLKKLQELNLRDTGVSNLAPLASLKHLQKLDLGSTEVSDLAPLASVENLQELVLGHTQVSDLTPLASLKDLKRLDLIKVPLTRLGPLAHLENLQELDLSLTQISDLTPLASLKNLKRLDLRGTKVRDLRPLAKLEKLEWLDLTFSPVTNVAPLASLKNLRFLLLGSDNGQINDQQVDGLRRALPNCSISVDGIGP